MKICNHNIDKSEIIGIGPLLLVRNTGSVFQETHYSFQLHCRYRSIEINSDKETFIGNTEHISEAKGRLLKFKDEYESVMEAVELIIKDK